MNGATVLEFEHVDHAYESGVPVLRDVNLAIRAGEIFCLLGPSGCGKTTALRLAAGLEECQKGRISINGEVVSDGAIHVPPERRSVGLVFQDVALFPHLSVADNVGFGLGALGAEARAARIADMLRQVNMGGYANVFPHVLSGGQQQRVALARALAPDPKLLLLDEPFSGLDPRTRSMISEEMLAVIKAHGTTALVVTHDPEEAMYVADRIALMNDGRIEQVGQPGDIYCHPVSPFVTRFFSSTNRFSTRVAGGKANTPFGPVAAPAGAADGQAVDVLIRPEALRILSTGAPAQPDAVGTIEARVLDARILRRAVFMNLCIGDFEGRHLHFHARDPGHRMPQAGGTVRVALDPEQTFVFKSQS